jgi:outer membrane protein assembly factor BamB
LWDSNKITTSGACPVVHEGTVYSISRAGILTAGDAESGKVRWSLRLKGPVWATPIVAGGHLYLISFDGLAQIVELPSKPGEEATLVSSSEFGERVQGTPAVGDGALYVRSDKHLWRISEK